MKKTVKHYLQDLKDYTERILEDMRDLSEERFMRDQLTQDAMLRRIEVIGEIAKRFPVVYKERYPNTEWRKVAGVRDRIAHDYDGIDLKIVWNIIVKEIPKLQEQVIMMLREEENHLVDEKDWIVKVN
jgi:uncharacterized protein with HEPN domain